MEGCVLYLTDLQCITSSDFKKGMLFLTGRVSNILLLIAAL